jgi:hypothetical protein
MSRILVSLAVPGLVLQAACAWPLAAAAPEPERFAVASSYDLGIHSAPLATLTALTSGSPGGFMLDQVIAQLPEGRVKAALLEGEQVIATYLDGRLLAWAPELNDKLRALASDVGRAAHILGTSDTVTVAADGSTATHALDRLRVVAGGVPYELALTTYGIAPIAAPVLDVAFGDGALALGPSPCPTVAVLHAGDATTFTTACRDALSAVAGAIDADLDALDAQGLALDLRGAAAAPLGPDGRIDTLYAGFWTRTVERDGPSSPLAAGSFSERSPFNRSRDSARARRPVAPAPR